MQIWIGYYLKTQLNAYKLRPKNEPRYKYGYVNFSLELQCVYMYPDYGTGTINHWNPCIYVYHTETIHFHIEIPIADMKTNAYYITHFAVIPDMFSTMGSWTFTFYQNIVLTAENSFFALLSSVAIHKTGTTSPPHVYIHCYPCSLCM